MTSNRTFQRLRAADTAAWLASHPGALVLDARDAQHHASDHLPGSLRLDGRNHEMLLLREPKERPVFIYCYKGNTSSTYAQMFVDFGFHTVCDLEGGFDAWLCFDAAPPASPSSLPACPEPLASWLAGNGFADPHSPGAHGNTPLMHAAWRGETAIAQALLGQGVPLDAVNSDGNNALWLACVSNQPALVGLLARAGVPIDHQNLTGATCLMYAASSSKPTIVRTLLALGANPHMRTQDDFSALDMAADIDSLRILRTT